MPSSTSWSSLHDRLHQTLRHRRLTHSKQRIILAVSGGQDSLCLAQLMVDLRPKWSWFLGIAHCNHRWHHHSTNAIQIVQDYAQQWHLPFFLETAPDEVAADQSEATARTWRYQALAHLAQTQGYHQVFTGHTASDRAETLLYNLFRGSGMDGLPALSWRRSLSSQVEVVRPLLNVTRSETLNFCQQRALTMWDDPSNQNLQYQRNRIRQEVLPLVRDRFNPNIEQALAQTAELLRADVDFLEQETESAFRQSVDRPNSEPTGEADLRLYSESLAANTYQDNACQDSNPLYRLRIDRYYLQTLPLALQRRVMRRCLQQLLPTSPNFEHVEKLVYLVDAPNRSQTDPFPGGAIARVEGAWILWLESTSSNA